MKIVGLAPIYTDCMGEVYAFAWQNLCAVMNHLPSRSPQHGQTQ